MELSGWVRAPAGFSLSAAFTHLDSKNVSNPNDPVGQTCSTCYRATLRYDDARDRLFAEYELRGSGDRTNDLLGSTVPGFIVHSARAGVTVVRRGRHTQRLGLAVLNLADALYAESANVSFFRPETGRSLLVTYDVTF